jgi:hypothetical protein
LFNARGGFRKWNERSSKAIPSARIERDRLASHLYPSRREYRLASEGAGEGGKEIERCLIFNASGCRENALQMARPLRLEGPGYWFHVTGRGNARGTLFLDGSDRRRFVELLSEVESRYGLEVHAYVLIVPRHAFPW